MKSQKLNRLLNPHKIILYLRILINDLVPDTYYRQIIYTYNMMLYLAFLVYIMKERSDKKKVSILVLKVDIG